MSLNSSIPRTFTVGILLAQVSQSALAHPGGHSDALNDLRMQLAFHIHDVSLNATSMVLIGMSVVATGFMLHGLSRHRNRQARDGD